MQIILISLPVFVIILGGWLLKKLKVVENDWVHILNSFAYYIALPCLIISSFWVINFQDTNTWKLIFESIFIIILFSILIFLLLSFLKIKKALLTTILLGSTVGNCVFLGFPLVDLNFGKIYFEQATLIGSFLLIIPIIFIIIFIQFRDCSKKRCLREELTDLIKNPLVLAIIIGILFSFLKIENPIFNGLKKTILMLGATASPIALFALGAFLHGQSKKNLKLSFLISFFKMIFLPIIAVIISLLVFKNYDLKVLTLMASMPVAVTTFVIAEKFELNKELIGSAILVSTILSFLITSLIVSIFI